MKQEKKFYLTKEGLEEKKSEYEILKKIRAEKTSQDAPAILESDDLNPEYVSFQEDLSRINSEIIELENIFKNVVIINELKKYFKDDGIIKVGSKVLIEIDGQEQDEFTIVGTLEAKPSLGIISNESPVGKALLGHRVGDSIFVSSPIKTTYKIKRIIS